jgi:uncharacterized membrane protein
MREKSIHRIFEISILLKGAHALIECLGGVAIALVSGDYIRGLVNSLTQDELVEDPQDFVATHLLAFARDFTVSTQHFYAFYLLSHGAVKLVLVAGLLRNKPWAYPASLVALSFFILYQLYRYSYTHGFGLILLTIFDVVLMWLIWHEYQLLRRDLPLE